MISYGIYKVLHLTGILFLFAALGALALHARLPQDDDVAKKQRRTFSIVHGVAMLIILVAGMGLLARTGISHGASWPGWVWVKVFVWLLLGGSVVLLRKLPAVRSLAFFALPLIGAVAAYFAVHKPMP